MGVATAAARSREPRRPPAPPPGRGPRRPAPATPGPPPRRTACRQAPRRPDSPAEASRAAARTSGSGSPARPTRARPPSATPIVPSPWAAATRTSRAGSAPAAATPATSSRETSPRTACSRTRVVAVARQPPGTGRWSPSSQRAQHVEHGGARRPGRGRRARSQQRGPQLVVARQHLDQLAQRGRGGRRTDVRLVEQRRRQRRAGALRHHLGQRGDGGPAYLRVGVGEERRERVEVGLPLGEVEQLEHPRRLGAPAVSRRS